MNTPEEPLPNPCRYLGGLHDIRRPVLDGSRDASEASRNDPSRALALCSADVGGALGCYAEMTGCCPRRRSLSRRPSG